MVANNEIPHPEDVRKYLLRDSTDVKSNVESALATIPDPQDVLADYKEPLTKYVHKKKDVKTREEEFTDAAAIGFASIASAGSQRLADTFAKEPPYSPFLGGATIVRRPSFRKQARKRARVWEDRAKFFWEMTHHPSLQTTRDDYLTKGVRMIGQTLPYITATTVGFTLLGPGGAFYVGSLVEGNNAYRTALDNGVDEERARNIGAAVGIVSGAIEAFGGLGAEKLVASAINKVKSKALAKGAKFAVNSIIEALEEAGQELAALTGESSYRDIGWREYVARTMQAFGGGLFLGGTMKGLSQGFRATFNPDASTDLMTPRQSAVQNRYNNALNAIRSKYGVGKEARSMILKLNEEAKGWWAEAESADLQEELEAEFSGKDVSLDEWIASAERRANEKRKAAKLFRPKQGEPITPESMARESREKIVEQEQRPRAFAGEPGPVGEQLAEEELRAMEPRKKPDYKPLAGEGAKEPERKGSISFRTTGLPYYDGIMNKPVYHREQKGITGRVVYMSPDEYIDKAAELQGVSREETLRHIDKGSQKYLRSQVEKGEQLDMPVLNYDTKVQEGRNRAMLAKDMGQDSIPVFVVEKAAAAEATVRQEKTDNPYVTMPIERVYEDAANGVKLAKEALADLDPESLITQKVRTPATPGQKKLGHRLKDDAGLSDEQYRALIKDATGLDSMAEMNVEEAEDAIMAIQNLMDSVRVTKQVAKIDEVLIDPAIPPGYNKRIRNVAGSDEVYNKTILYSNKHGGVPKNIDIPNLDWRQKRYAEDLINVGNVQRRAETKRAKREPVGKQFNVINPWSSARYSLAQAGIKSGVPLRRVYSNIAYKANQIRIDNAQALDQALKRAGASKIAPVSHQEGIQIANWLFENGETNPIGKQQYWEAMPPGVQKIATEIDGFLQNESANQVRWARWIKWDRAARKADRQTRRVLDKGHKLTKERLERIMKPVKKAKPRNAPLSALEEGRAAQEIGQLREWIESQTWGTMKHYYMSESELKDLTSLYPTGSIPEELEQMADLVGSPPEQVLPETMTREGKGKIAKGGNLLQAVLNHANRVGTFAATYDDLQNFWEAFASTNPSPRDIARVRKLVNTSLGFRHAVDEWVEPARKANAAFWRAYFAFSPKRSAWFIWRNLHQNIAYGMTQGDMKQAAISSKVLIKAFPGLVKGKGITQDVDSVNPWIREDYNNYWESRVSQRRQLYQQFILQKQGAIVNDFGNKATAVMDAIGSIPMHSDEFNRMSVWPLFHQTAFRNSKQLMNGKITAKQFWNNLSMDTLHLDQRIEMHRLMDEGKFRELTNNYAEYKTENIHFRYETDLRSIAEQTPGGMMAMGLMTFPRGTFEIMYQNGVKPFLQGYESGNYRQSYEGLKTITLGIVGSRMARYLLYAATGRMAYGIFDTIFRYSPGAPGPRRIAELADTVSDTLWRADNEGLSFNKTLDAMMAATSYQAELFIPMMDVYLDLAEAHNDDRGRRMYTELKRLGIIRFQNETGIKYREANRDSLQYLQHAFWGGAEKGRPVPPKTRPRRKRRTRSGS